MSRAVPNQNSSPESFARLLNRLTKAPGSYSPALDPDADQFPDPYAATPADDYAVRVSISSDGAAALNGSRKRAMAPVRVSGPTRNATEASEISYEDALRLHSRPRAAELPELPPPEKPLPSLKTKPASTPARLSRLEAEAKALAALRQAKNRASTRRPETPSTPKIESASGSRPPQATASGGATPVNFRQAARNKKKQPERPSGVFAQATDATPAHPSHTQRNRKRPKSNPADSSLSANSPAIPPHAARRATAGNMERKQSRATAENQSENQPAKQSGNQPAVSPLRPSNTRSGSLELEVASQHLALGQRQSIVSIRLSSIESEQLRQRAAESGISVSAYMRSCVLEAEHLRSQVKQALAELRTLHPLPAQAQLEPPPLFASVYTPPSAPARDIRPGLFGFLSGIAAIVLGRFQR